MLLFYQIIGSKYIMILTYLCKKAKFNLIFSSNFLQQCIKGLKFAHLISPPKNENVVKYYFFKEKLTMNSANFLVILTIIPFIAFQLCSDSSYTIHDAAAISFTTAKHNKALHCDCDQIMVCSWKTLYNTE